MMAGINELMKRYGITTAQGMTRTIRVHLDALNADGEHARKVGKEWQLDEVAIRRLDGIRGLTESEAVQNLENEEIRSLTVTVQNLQTALLHAQHETAEVQKQVLQAQAALTQEKDRAFELQEKQAAAEIRAAQSETRQEAMQRDIDRLSKELQETRQERDRMTHASLWQRITGRW